MKIFVSYRRRDEPGIAGRLADHLREANATGSVFFDTSSVPGGADYSALIQKEIREADVIVVVIGEDWRPERLFDPDDMVLFELRDAIAQNKRLLPVLVENAAPVKLTDLPADLKPLASINAMPLSHARFDSDLGEIRRVLGLSAPTRTSVLRSVKRMTLGALGGTALAGALLLAAALANKLATGSPLSRSIGGDENSMILIALALIAGAGIGTLRAFRR